MAAAFLGWCIGFGSGLLTRIFFRFAVELAASSRSDKKLNFWWVLLAKLVLVCAGLLFGVKLFSYDILSMVVGLGIGMLMGVLFPIGIFSGKD